MIEWEKYGFKEIMSLNNKEIEHHVFKREDFPFALVEDNNHLIVLYADKTTTVEVSRGKIPATNQAVVLLLKAFNCPKLP